MAKDSTGTITPATTTADDRICQDTYQDGVKLWLESCFGSEIASDRQERCHRFLEEALELAQACGCTRKDAIELVQYVFNRPTGDKRQEVGGAMVTLAGLCHAHDLDMQACADAELARNWTKVDQIRLKQANKPKNSPLPQHVSPDDAITGPQDLYQSAKTIFQHHGSVSYILLQRHMKVGYNKAMDLIERMEEEGFVSVPDSRGQRHIVTEIEMENGL